MRLLKSATERNLPIGSRGNPISATVVEVRKGEPDPVQDAELPFLLSMVTGQVADLEERFRRPGWTPEQASQVKAAVLFGILQLDFAIDGCPPEGGNDYAI